MMVLLFHVEHMNIVNIILGQFHDLGDSLNICLTVPITIM